MVEDDITFPIQMTGANGRMVKGSYRAHIIDKDCPALWCLPSIRALGGVVKSNNDTLNFPDRAPPV
eukprot:6782789-Heterocapsa_arctica.AAC.1